MKSIRRTLWVIVALFGLSGIFPALGGGYRPQRIEEVTATLPDTQVILKGVRYSHPDSKKGPVILFHGFTNNTRTLRDLGYALHEQGYDVWLFNFRGHGNGEHRSVVKKMHRSAYAYEGIALEDVHTAVEHVYAQTAKKAHLMGFSMGGMASLNYAEGWHYRAVPRPRGKVAYEIVLDGERARWIGRERIKSLTLIGSPKHLENLGSLFKFFSKAIKGVTSLSGVIPRVSPDRTPTDPAPRGRLELLRKKSRRAAVPALKAVLPLEVWNPDNTTDRELYGVLEKGMSKPHPQVVESFRRAAETGRMTDLSGRVNFSEIHPIYVDDTFLVAGELDGLARAEDVMEVRNELARVAPAGTRVRETLVVKNASHGDLITGEFQEKYLAPWVIRFMEGEATPTSSGPADGCGSRALKRVVYQLKGGL